MYYVAVTSGCPEEFHYYEAQNHCYSLFPVNLRWESASQLCRALDSRAHLLVINNEEEQEFITEVSCKLRNCLRNSEKDSREPMRIL